MHFPANSFIAALCLTVCGTVPAQAFELSTQGLVVSGYATSMVICAPFDNKLILAARDDAAAFIASDGQLRGVRLESALNFLRRTQSKLHASDLELAQVILVQ
jgi:uncharacterized protein (TIGR02448 family)